MALKKGLILFVMLCTCVFACAGQPRCIFQNYSTRDGLTHDNIADIYTDSRGFVWLCTWYGVSRFDGYTFRNFGVQSSDYSVLSHHRFVSVNEDSAGHLWFKTYNERIYRFNRYTQRFEDVLSQIEGFDVRHSRVNQCKHDADGATWISLHGGGVVCFSSTADASPAKVEAQFNSADLDGDVTALHIDRQGNTWIASSGGRLNFVAAGDRHSVKSVVDTEMPVFAFAESGAKVYGTTPQAIVRADKHGKSADIFENTAGARFTAVAADTIRRVLYAGDAAGNLFKIQGEKGLERLSPHGLRGERIRDLKADSHGTLWITTPEAGISRYNPILNDVRHFEQKPYNVSYNVDTLARVVESGGRVWIKMNRYGFGYYDRDHDSVEPFYNDPEQLNCRMTNAVACFDASGDVLWLSTYYERGLRKALIVSQPTDMLTVGSKRPLALAGGIRALMCDKRGRLWVGTRDGELICFDSSVKRRFYTMPQSDIGMVYAIKEDSHGYVWVGTNGKGLYRLAPNGSGSYDVIHFVHSDDDPWSLSDDRIDSIEEDDSGRIWIGTFGSGICMLESPQSTRFFHKDNGFGHYPDDALRVRWLTFDRNGRMIAAIAEGLMLFNPDDNPEDMRFKLVQLSYDEQTSLGSNDIMQTFKDSRGDIWVATYGGGLSRIKGYNADGEPQFQSYDIRHGLPSNICMAMTEDRLGDLWISTPNAVTRFDTDSELFFNYPLYDDMRNADFNETTAVTMISGDVLFSGGRHLYKFDPAGLRQAKSDYKLHFTGLTVANVLVTVGEEAPITEAMTEASQIELPYDYANFRISFASLNYGIQHAVRYMYRLEGYDRTWTLAGSTTRAAYTNVPTGHYRFMVKAYVDNPSDAGEGISIDVRILPPWWFTWWAKLIYIILAVSIAYVALRTFFSVLRIRREASIEQNATNMKLNFFTNISHELRTPLTLILGGIEDVQKHDRLSPRGDSSLELAHRNAKRMLSLINHLLDFRKIVKDKMELKISRVDLVPLVEDALDDFRELASERDINLLFTVSRRSMPVWIDHERMESVIYNLLSNAMKFTRNGGKIETILTLNEHKETVLITVRDTGVGIPKDKISTIFEYFAQALPSVDPSMKGSGIGLSLCREIVALHHGEITVESRQGVGSTFTVKLKTGNAHFGMDQIEFANNDYLVSDLTVDNGVRRTDIEPPKDAQKILLTEDNRDMRIFMYNRLIENYNVIEADDGEDALTKIRTEMPDIVITDLMMPRMDGIELIDNIRKDFTISHIPIVMLTARHSPDERMKAMEYGADGYITKPFDIELLLACIENLLTQRRKLFEKYSSQAANNKIVELTVSDVVVTNRDEEFMKSVMTWLDENMENTDLTIDQLAAHVGLGRTTMYNKLKGLTGKSPVELIKEYRLMKSQLFLKTGQFSVSEVAYKTGFSDPGYFSRCFRDQFGMSPAEYMRSQNLRQSNDDTKIKNQ